MQSLLENLESRTLLAAATLHLDGGNSPAAPTGLGRVGGQVIVQDQLAAGETVDYFNFSVRSGANLNIVLSGLTSAANLVLLSSRGQTISFSTRSGTRTDAVSLAVRPDNYIIGVVRRFGTVATPYSLSIQADLNYGRVAIDGQVYTLGLIRADGTSAPIIASRTTWVVIHGWLGSPRSIHPLARAIDAASHRDQVLELDWSGPAAELNTVTTIGRVPEVGAWAAAKLNAWGIAGARLNLVGHSMGGYMTDLIARDISGGVASIVAMDPATPALGNIDFSGTNFAARSQHSLAFLGSDFATPAAAWTADHTTLLSIGTFSNILTHMNVLDLFTRMTELNNTSTPGPIAPFFALNTLTPAGRPPFTTDAFSSEYESTIAGESRNGRMTPTVLSYRSTVTGQIVTVRA